MPPPYPGPFFPGHVNELATTTPPPPSEPSAPPSVDLWFMDMDDNISVAAAAVDGARGGADLAVDKKRPTDDEDDDEGHFIPDAVEMKAKLEEAIPPPPHLNYDQRRHHHHHQRPVHEQRARHAEDSNYFVPSADTLQHRSTAVPVSPAPAPSHGGLAAWGSSPPSSSTGWRRQASTETTGAYSDSMTGTTSLCSGTAGGFTSSSSSRRPSPYMPSTASSSSVSSQSRFVLSDDPDTTQTDVDYY